MSENDEELGDRVDAEEARVIVGRRGAMVIDIRSEEEFAEERIFSAIRCDPDDVAAKLEETREDDADPGAVLLVCEDGSRSGELADQLRGDGVQVSSLDGGFAAWTSEHLPTAPGRDEEYEGPTLKIPGAVASESGKEEDDAETDAGEAEADDEGERGRPRPEEVAGEKQADRAEES